MLDFGCGPGQKLVEFYQRGWSVAGIDLNELAIAKARALMPEGEWFAGPLERAPAWAPFDVIRSDNVVEHLPDPLDILSRLRRMLTPRGRVLVYVPSGEALSVKLLGGRSQSSWIPFHLQLFSRRGLQALFRRAGFENVTVRGYTPTSWWELTARQALAEPGFAKRSSTARERAAMLGAKVLAPVWMAATRFSLGEEWIVDARG